MVNQWLAAGWVGLFLGLALGFDLATRRIPNWLVALALVAAVILNILTGFTSVSFADIWNGVGKSVLGAMIGLLVMLPFYLLHAMGAGDVKLMAAVGALLGPIQILGAALLVFLAGGVLSLIAALWAGTLKRVADNLRSMFVLVISGRNGMIQEIQTTGRLPYALAIAAGTAFQIWLATQSNWPFK